MFKRGCFYVLYRFFYVFAFLIGACSELEPTAKSATVSGPRYFRVQSSYEVVKTGEIVEFDYVYACGEIKARHDGPPAFGPSSVYKATKNGAAIGFRPMMWPCLGSRKTKNRAVNRSGGGLVEDIGRVVWYPDVENMHRGFAYVSADAFQGPNAHLRVLNYDLEVSTLEARRVWLEKAEAEFVQVGNLPGPFGLGVADHPREITKPGVSYEYYYVKPMTDDFYDLFQPIYAPDGERFTCSLDSEVTKKLNLALGLDEYAQNTYRHLPSSYKQVMAENDLAFGRTFHSTPIDLPTARGDSDVIERSRKRQGKHETREVFDVYPFIEMYNKEDVAKNLPPPPEVDVLQILNSDTYRGFGFAQGRGNPYFHPIDLDVPRLPNDAKGIYLGDVKMCDQVYNQGPSMIYDWVRRVQYEAQNWTSEL